MKSTASVAVALCIIVASIAQRQAVALPLATGEQDESTTVAIVDLTPISEQNVESTTILIAEMTEIATESTAEITEPTETVTDEATIPSTVRQEDTTTETAIRTAVEPVAETTVQTTTVNTMTVEATGDTQPAAVEATTEAIQYTTVAAEVPIDSAISTANNTTPLEVVKDKLSEQIRKILKHYQRPDPVGFPGAPIPDPLSIPPMKKNFGLADMTFTNMTVHGMSKFKVENVNTDLKNMQVYVLLKIKRMYVYGNYTLKSWFGRPAAGPFNVTLIDVDAEAAAALEPDEEGNLQAADTEMDMRFRDCELDFKNLGFMASMFQGIISSVGSVLFEGIKPFIISEVNNNLKTDVNAQVKAITKKLPKMKVPMADLAVAEGRAYVRRMGYDPYHVANRHIKEGPLDLGISDLTINGLSEFRRVGDIGLQIRGSVFQMTVHVITGPVNGTLRWTYQVGLAKTFSRTGVSNFTVDHIQVRAVVNQTLDIRNKPVLDQLDIEVGKATVQMDRKEPLDYVIELAVNSLPTLLRHIIVDVLEEPIKVKVQTILDDVQMEKMVEDRLPELDRLETS